MIKNAAKLVSSAKHRKEQGLFFAEGTRLCVDAMQSGVFIEQLFFTAEAAQKQPEAVMRLMEKSGEAYEISADIARKLGDTERPQGIFCICRMLDKKEEMYHINRYRRLIGLENIQDPSNMGTILRTAEALGMDGAVVAGGCCDIYSPKVLRGSMGAVFRLPIWETAGAVAAVERLQNNGLIVYAAVPDANALLVTDCIFAKTSQKDMGAVLFVGNEGNGLEEQTIAACNARVTIPMEGRAESLNAAVAASILMWEMMRRAPAGRNEGSSAE